ncbi:MAG: hypothetical protein ACKO6N_25280 [Myxococcota bacterium]
MTGLHGSRMEISPNDKSHRANASQFFVAGELCRRGYVAVVTLGNTPNTDVLCSNGAGTKFVHIQVKTFVPGNKTCSVGAKAETAVGDSFFWIIAGIPLPNTSDPFRYFVIPSHIMADHVSELHKKWLREPGNKGQPRRDSRIRVVGVDAKAGPYVWNVTAYEDRWDLIDAALKA